MPIFMAVYFNIASLNAAERLVIEHPWLIESLHRNREVFENDRQEASLTFIFFFIFILSKAPIRQSLGPSESTGNLFSSAPR